jgi:hypothetical protein
MRKISRLGFLFKLTVDATYTCETISPLTNNDKEDKNRENSATLHYVSAIIFYLHNSRLLLFFSFNYE